MKITTQIYENEGYWRDGGESGHGEWEPYAAIYYYLRKNFDISRQLDIGSGPGEFIRYGRIGDIYGLDLSKYAVSHPLPGADGKIAFGDVTDIPFKDGFFDAVTAFNLMEHIPPDRAAAAVKEIFRVSKRWIILMICVSTDYDPPLEYNYHNDELGSYPERIQGEIKRGHWCVHPREWWLSLIGNRGRLALEKERQILEFVSQLIPQTDKNWTFKSKGLLVFEKPQG